MSRLSSGGARVSAAGRCGRLSAAIVPAVLLTASPAVAQRAGDVSGADVYAAHCSACHDAADSHAPPRSALAEMPAARILRTLDFGTMMSVTYMLDRARTRGRVGLPRRAGGEERGPPAAAYCTDRSVRLSASPGDLERVEPGRLNTRFQADARPRRRRRAAADARNGRSVSTATSTHSRRPTVIDDQLFVGSAGGGVYALEAARAASTGSIRPTGPCVPPSRSRSAHGRATALFGDQIGGFYALDAATGRLLWKRRPEAHEATKLTGAPLVDGGRVYVPVASWEESRPLNPAYPCCTFRGSVVAYSIEDGAEIWKSYLVTEVPRQTSRTAEGAAILGPSGAGTWSAPTLDTARGRLYVTTGNNYTGQTTHSDAVVALSLEDGRIVWSRQLTPGDEFNLYCRNHGGCPGDDSDFGASAVLARAADGRDVLVAGQKSGVVYGLDPDRDGALRWQARVGRGGINGGVLWGMASDGRHVYAAVSDLGRSPRPDTVKYDWRPTGVDPGTGGGLTALRLEDGGRAWYAPPAACTRAGPSAVPRSRRP